MSMRVCLVSTEVAPFRGAGIGAYVTAAARAWAEGGHEAHLLTPPHAEINARAAVELPGVRVHQITDPGLSDAFDTDEPRFLQHSLAVSQQLNALHARHRFEYIEFADYGAEGYFSFSARRTLGALEGAVLGLRLHTPTRDCRALNQEAWLDESIATLEHCEEACLAWADSIISPSQGLIDRLLGRLGDRAPKSLRRASVVPYPFRVAPDAPHVSKADAPDGPQPQEILYFGRLERRKGVDLLIDAVQCLLRDGHDVRLTLVGGDTRTGPGARSMRAALKRRIDRTWLERFHFEEPKTRSELRPLIQCATLCCFPSRWENFPNVCLESMALGACVVGSNAGGMAEIIEDGDSGLLFDAGDVGSLRDALARGLADAPLRRRLRERAPHRIRALCDPARVTREMVAVISASAGRQADAARATRELPAQASPNGREGRPEGARSLVPSSAPRVSIIVPFFNIAEFLPATIASIRAQTSRDYEIIVVDDGSTGRQARALVDDIEHRRAPWQDVRLVRKANGGLASARNAGIAIARGEWILPLDADDLLHPRYLERVLDAARRDPSLGMVTTLVSYFHRDAPGGGPDCVSGGRVYLGFVRDLLVAANCASCSTALIRRDVLDAVGGYDESLPAFEDWDLYCSLAQRGVRAAVVPEFLFYYRYRVDSLVRTEGARRRDQLRAYILAKHPDLADDASRAARLLLSQVYERDPMVHAQRLAAENLRYRIADRINTALRRTPLHSALKVLTKGAMAMGKDER